MKKFYITSAIPYVNAHPHIGHALEFIQTDAIARYHRLRESDVVTLCGGDENALKNVQAAEKSGMPIQQFIDENNASFETLSKKLNASYSIWQKGSDQTHHFPASQKLWNLCNDNGDIYKKSYSGLYCVGCEAFYTPEELSPQGECFEHPGKKLESVTETNYFFKLSAFQQRILDLINSDTLQIVPEKRKNEVVAFIERGLEDISISRSNERAKNWGVPVPNDDSQRMYVWFDALNIYQSGAGFGWDEKLYDSLWPADIQVIGKGITRFHAVYWPAFLLSAGLKIPKKIFVHEYFTVNGQKMSKTLGNVIDPIALIEKYGVDPLRYYFLAKFTPFNDGDFSEEEFKKTYNADLANGLGNLVARVAKLAEKVKYHTDQTSSPKHEELFPESAAFFEQFRFDSACSFIWSKLSEIDKKIETVQPWKLEQGELIHFINEISPLIRTIAYNLKPILPETSEKILNQFNGDITSQSPLFPRIS